MSKTVLYMSMSVEGFIAGPNAAPGNGLGDKPTAGRATITTASPSSS